MAALWVLGLGALAAVLATLSLITRKNSRHPLLVVGLAALGITYLSLRIMPRLAGERARTVAQAFAIVERRSLDAAPTARCRHRALRRRSRASAVLVAFGLTIVIKRASTAVRRRRSERRRPGRRLIRTSLIAVTDLKQDLAALRIEREPERPGAGRWIGWVARARR